MDVRQKLQIPADAAKDDASWVRIRRWPALFEAAASEQTGEL